MKVFGFVGESIEIIQTSPRSPEEIEMRERRPSGQHVAAASIDADPRGMWVLPSKADVPSLKAAITQKRWEVETGGITLQGGVSVSTGIDDQNRITSVIANARLAGLTEVSFKAASGWVTLTLAELEGVAAAIAMHVQQCFSAELAHHEAIDALEQLHAGDAQALRQALEAYDLEQGWPSSASANQ